MEPKRQLNLYVPSRIVAMLDEMAEDGKYGEGRSALFNDLVETRYRRFKAMQTAPKSPASEPEKVE